VRANFIGVGYCGSVQRGGKNFVKVLFNNLYFTFLCVVEEPSYDFLRLRDYVDALACSKLSAFAADNLRNGFSDKMVQQAREELKINKVSNNMEIET